LSELKSEPEVTSLTAFDDIYLVPIVFAASRR
jgi:hypothetical protein